jgi:hypothetical protein
LIRFILVRQPLDDHPAVCHCESWILIHERTSHAQSYIGPVLSSSVHDPSNANRKRVRL